MSYPGPALQHATGNFAVGQYVDVLVAAGPGGHTAFQQAVGTFGLDASATGTVRS